MKKAVVLGLTVAAVLIAPVAGAQEDSGTESSSFRGTAPEQSFEIITGSGFTQAFGAVGGDTNLDDVGGPGTAFQLGLGYRLNPRLMLGVYGEGAVYQPERGSFGDRRMFSAASGFQVQYHFLPFARFDPWLGVGSGWRGYWISDDDQGATSLHGLDIVRVQAGVGYQVTESWNVNPVVGASMTHFLTQKGPGDDGFHDVDDGRPNTFFFAGILSRFEIGGARVRKTELTASR